MNTSHPAFPGQTPVPLRPCPERSAYRKRVSETELRIFSETGRREQQRGSVPSLPNGFAPVPERVYEHGSRRGDGGGFDTQRVPLRKKRGLALINNVNKTPVIFLRRNRRNAGHLGSRLIRLLLKTNHSCCCQNAWNSINR